MARTGAAMIELWKNDSPSTAFDAQTIQISGLSNYDEIMIEVATSTTYPLHRAGTIIGYEAGAQAHPAVVWYGTAEIVAHYRIAMLAENAVAFGTGYRVGPSSATTDAAYAIPIRVVGIKYNT